MSARRPDLLELTPEALTALSNAGFVKRAQKDVAAGALPQIDEGDDGSIMARYGDGHCATLPAGSALQHALCTCPSSGQCRHRVTLVLAYQQLMAKPGTVEQAWTPACFAAELTAQLPRRLMTEAKRLAAQRPVLHLTAWQATRPVPTARMPLCSVRFFSRSSLAHSHCDCKSDGLCAHIVLAVRAFAQAEAAQPGFVELTLALDADAETRNDDEAKRLRTAIRALLLQIWVLGAAQPLLALEAAFEQVDGDCERLGWCWVGVSLRAIRAQIAAHHARSTRFDPQLLLVAMAGLEARLTAALHAQDLADSGQTPTLPSSQILGIGVAGEVRLDHLGLLSMGAELWSDDAAEGARLVFADPATLAITVIERSWPKAATAAKPVPMTARRIAGQALALLAASQVVSNGARRRANGQLELPSAARQISVLKLTSTAWDGLQAPLRQADLAALRTHLLKAAPDFVRPVQAIEQLHVLPVAQVERVAWDAARQALVAEVWVGQAESDHAEMAAVIKRNNPTAPSAIDALAAALAGAYGAVQAIAGIVRLEGGMPVIEPFALLTAERAVVPDVEPTATTHALAHGTIQENHSATLTTIRQVLALLAHWACCGLRQLGPLDLQQADMLVEQMQKGGLTTAGGLLRSVAAAIPVADKSGLPKMLSVLVSLPGEIVRSG